MGNQLKIVATINPANTAVEVSTDNGATFRGVAMSTVGSQQEGILTGVAAATYAAGTIKIRAVAFPAVGASEPLARTVVDATLAPFLVLSGQSLALGTGSVVGAGAVAGMSTLSPLFFRTYANTDILYLGRDPYNTTGGTLQALALPTTDTAVGSNNMALGDAAYHLNAAPNAAQGSPGSFGLEAPLAYLYNREQPAQKLRVVKRTADGRPISFWPGATGITAKQIADFNNAKAQLPAGVGPQVLAFVWVQGESDTDAGRTTAQYQADLTAVLQAYRDGGVIQPNTIIILSGEKRGAGVGAAVELAKKNICAADTSGRTRFVDITDLATYDQYHPTGPSYLTFGERVYNKIFTTTAVIIPAAAAFNGVLVDATKSIEEDNAFWTGRAQWTVDTNAVYSAGKGESGVLERTIPFRLTQPGYFIVSTITGPGADVLGVQVTGNALQTVSLSGAALQSSHPVITSVQLAAGDYTMSYRSQGTGAVTCDNVTFYLGTVPGATATPAAADTATAPAQVFYFTDETNSAISPSIVTPTTYAFVGEVGGAYATIGNRGAYVYGKPDALVKARATNVLSVSLDCLVSVYGGDVELLCDAVVLATASSYAAATGPTRLFTNVLAPDRNAHIWQIRQKAGATAGTILTLARFIFNS